MISGHFELGFFIQIGFEQYIHEIAIVSVEAVDFGSLFVLLENVLQENVESDIDVESFLTEEPEWKPLQWTLTEEISEGELRSDFNGVVN